MALQGPPVDADPDVQRWKEWKFPSGTRARAAFEYLCINGCDPRALLSFLTVAVFSAHSRDSIYDSYGIDRSAVVKLPDKLDKISGDIEAVCRYLETCLVSFVVESPNFPEAVRSSYRRRLDIYRNIPNLLRTLATDLRRADASVFPALGPKRFDHFRKYVVELLQYVEASTKSPHYQEVSELLEQLHASEQPYARRLSEFLPKRIRKDSPKDEGAPKLFTSPDALKALYHRWLRYGFRKNLRQGIPSA